MAIQAGMTPAQAVAALQKVRAAIASGRLDAPGSRRMLVAIAMIRAASDAGGALAPLAQARIAKRASTVEQTLPAQAADIVVLKASARVILAERSLPLATLDAELTALVAAVPAQAAKKAGP